jgi:hypothetical protein
MTVQELINELQLYEKDLPVYLYDSGDFYFSAQSVRVENITLIDEDDEPEIKALVIDCK